MGLLENFEKKINQKKEQIHKPATQVHHPKLNPNPQFREIAAPELDDVSDFFDENMPIGGEYPTGEDTGWLDNGYGFPSQGQKPEGFHYFILENQYQDIERAIRGYKDMYNGKTERWELRKKAEHCFTDEEAETIVRTAQSHLSTDVKLALISKDEYPILMTSIYNQLRNLFRSIMEYRFGRFGSSEKQYKMKLEAVNIFQMLVFRIKMNYSRAWGGNENKVTHESVKGQESLQQIDRKFRNDSYT